jgi:tetratricopeptide (TPR) repeat protein
MSRRLAMFLAILLLGGTVAASALDTVSFEAPVLDAQDRELAQLIDGLLERTRFSLATLHGDVLAVSTGAGAPYALKTVASRDGKAITLVIVLRRVRDDVEAAPILWLAPATDDLPLFLARSIYVRWRLLSGTAPAGGAGPVLVDEVSPEDLKATQFPHTPMGIAVQPDGMLLVTFGSACWQLDGYLRVVAEPGNVLSERGSWTYAYGVMTTPSGSIILKPSMGKELYRLAPGAAEPQRQPIGTEPSTTFLAAAPDGSLVAVDMMNRRAYRMSGNRQQTLPLYAHASHTIYTFGIAPDGSIWVWDQLLPGFRVHAPDGAVADFVLPLLASSSLPYPMAMSVGPDGDFILFGGGKLMKFDRDGALRWSLERIAGSVNEYLPQSAALAVDWPRGLIYLAESQGRRIVKLLDRDAAGRARVADPFAQKLAALRAGKEADDPSVAVQRARWYEEAGSIDVALSAWRRIGDLDPGNAEATRRLAALETAQLRRDGDALAARAVALLRQVGIENARAVYQQALAKYELALARSPGDADTQRAVRDLTKLFSDPEALKPSLRILDTRLEEIFPSKMQGYRDGGIGTVTVKNAGTAALEGIVATASLPSWFEAPLASDPAGRLEPGATATLRLRAVLQPKVLENDEDMDVTVSVEVRDGAGRATAVTSGATKLHRRSAITWEETGRIAGFITPNEETVAVLAAHLATVAADTKRRRLPTRFARAIAVCEGLAAYGLVYVEDPAAPISKVLGAGTVVDTVRFARDTLLRRTGDCDDTTVLLASALESAGVRTAVLTTPGHIFVAFDSGESVDAAAMLAAPPLELLQIEGTLWVPVETTVLKDGFPAAWLAASILVKKYRGAGLEVLPVHLLRDRWPALPLQRSTIAIAEPAPSVVAARFDAAVAGLDKAVHAVRFAELEAAAKGLGGRQELRVRMRQGILHAMFGKLADAEKVFRAAQAKDPAMASPWVNLANLQMAGGDLDAAIATLRAGLPKVEDASLLTYALARCYVAKGDTKNAELYLAETRKTSPQLAAQLGGGLESGSSSGRGAGGAGSVPPRWSMDD